MSFHNDKSEENPFLLAVTTDTPFLRKIGYACARRRSDVLSTRIARPGAAARYAAISSGERTPALINDGVAAAFDQFVAGMQGEYAGVGATRDCDERASRMI